MKRLMRKENKNKNQKHLDRSEVLVSFSSFHNRTTSDSLTVFNPHTHAHHNRAMHQQQTIKKGMKKWDPAFGVGLPEK